MKNGEQYRKKHEAMYNTDIEKEAKRLRATTFAIAGGRAITIRDLVWQIQLMDIKG